MSQKEGTIIEGVGRDAEIVTNENGGKQSKSPMALHLVDPSFLFEWAKHCSFNAKIKNGFAFTAMMDIAKFMQTGDKFYLNVAMERIEIDSIERLVRIAKVLQVGADRYEPNNWRLIPQESHINHALVHLIAFLSGDTQDDHIDHALCRLMMAYATSCTPGFKYDDYVLPSPVIEEIACNHPDFRPIIKYKKGETNEISS